jgi:hypothetical protein
MFLHRQVNFIVFLVSAAFRSWNDMMIFCEVDVNVSSFPSCHYFMIDKIIIHELPHG